MGSGKERKGVEVDELERGITLEEKKKRGRKTSEMREKETLNFASRQQ